MMLSKEEAICLILGFSEKHQVNSLTKLNKLLARLNLFQIPVNIDFTLNKFGSYNADLELLEDTQYYGVEEYEWNGGTGTKLVLKEEGKAYHSKIVDLKLKKMFTPLELEKVRGRINYLSRLSASEISNEEHKTLLVDVEDRFKLEQKINETYIDMMDLHAQLKSLSEESIADVKFKALIEFSYHLLGYLKNVKLKNIPSGKY